jgi:hypothetical protein
VQFSTKSVVIAVLEMVSFSMCVSSRAYLLKIRLRERRFVRRQGVMSCGAAGSKENNGDESRQQD